MARKGRRPPKGGKRPGSSSKRPKNSAGKLKDLLGIELEIYEGANPEWDWSGTPGDWGGAITPGGETGPVSPMDCERWPGSPFCSGWAEAFEWGIIPSFEIESIGISNCEVIINIAWSGFGWKQPTISIGWRKDSSECQVPEPEPDDQQEGGGGGGGADLPEVPLPDKASPDCIFAVGIEAVGVRKIIFVYKPVAFYTKAYVAANGKLAYEPFCLCHGLACPQSPYNAYAGGYASEVSFEELFTGGNYSGGGNNNGLFPRCISYNDIDGTVVDHAIGGTGKYLFSSKKLREVSLARPFDQNALLQHGLWPIGGGIISQSKAYWGTDPNPRPVWIRSVGYRGKWYNSFVFQARNYAQSRSTSSSTFFNLIWDQFPTRSPTTGECLIKSPEGDAAPKPILPEIAIEEIMEEKCCKAVLRKLKRIDAVLQPDKFIEFNQSGNPAKILGKIPKRLTTPEGSGYEEIAGYSDSLSALIRMLDRISGFWPATVEIADIDPNTEGNQEFSLQIHSISDGFKQALEALAHLVSRSSGAASSSDPDDDDDPTFKILAAILTEVGLTHKIAAITQHTANNIEEYLDYKVRQQEEFLPMAFNPLAEPTWKNLEYTKPTKGQLDLYIRELLSPSTQDIIITKMEETKLLSEQLMEILKHASAASAALTQQIKSKEDLKKALGTARFNALVQGALTMEQVRRVLGLPSSWDLEDFADNLEDNFHPDENVEATKHAETKPKQAKEKPRIKDISKNGRRRKR